MLIVAAKALIELPGLVSKPQHSHGTERHENERDERA
jgi:hypothetical protein